jgi:hypothetical protein
MRGAVMNTTTARATELAHRSGDGIAVSLFWSKRTGTVTIELVDDRRGERLEFAVARRNALEAFRHPYVYAPQPAATRFIASTKAVQR